MVQFRFAVLAECLFFFYIFAMYICEIVQLRLKPWSCSALPGNDSLKNNSFVHHELRHLGAGSPFLSISCWFWTFLSCHAASLPALCLSSALLHLVAPVSHYLFSSKKKIVHCSQPVCFQLVSVPMCGHILFTSYLWYMNVFPFFSFFKKKNFSPFHLLGLFTSSFGHLINKPELLQVSESGLEPKWANFLMKSVVLHTVHIKCSQT